MANKSFQKGLVVASLAGGVNVTGGSTVAFLNVVYETGDTVTCTDGVTTLTSDTSGNYVFGLNATGNWTLSLGNKTKIINAVYGNVYYIAMYDALPDTDRQNNSVLAEAYVGDFNERSTDWGGFTLLSPANISVENNALRMTGNGMAHYEMPALNQSFTVYGVMNKDSTTSFTYRMLQVWNAYSNGCEQMFYVPNYTLQIAYSSYGNDTTFGGDVTAKHAYAMSFDGASMKVRFYLDGVFLGEKSCSIIGKYINVAGSANNQYNPNCDVYFAAVVNETESDAVIIANQQKQMSMFNISN